jgi:hypothetical protein
VDIFVMNDGARHEAPADADALRQMIMGFRASQMIHVAARLGLADRLRGGPQAPETLAQAVGVEPQALARLLRALASPGVFAETPSGAFALTPLAEHLRSATAARRCEPTPAAADRAHRAGNAPSEAKLFDINMLVVAGGQERSERAHRALLEAAGFALTRAVPTASPLSVIEAAPA